MALREQWVESVPSCYVLRMLWSPESAYWRWLFGDGDGDGLAAFPPVLSFCRTTTARDGARRVPARRGRLLRGRHPAVLGATGLSISVRRRLADARHRLRGAQAAADTWFWSRWSGSCPTAFLVTTSRGPPLAKSQRVQPYGTYPTLNPFRDEGGPDHLSSRCDVTSQHDGQDSEADWDHSGAFDLSTLIPRVRSATRRSRPGTGPVLRTDGADCISARRWTNRRTRFNSDRGPLHRDRRRARPPGMRFRTRQGIRHRLRRECDGQLRGVPRETLRTVGRHHPGSSCAGRHDARAPPPAACAETVARRSPAGRWAI